MVSANSFLSSVPQSSDGHVLEISEIKSFPDFPDMKKKRKIQIHTGIPLAQDSKAPLSGITPIPLTLTPETSTGYCINSFVDQEQRLQLLILIEHQDLILQELLRMKLPLLHRIHRTLSKVSSVPSLRAMIR